MGFAPLVLATFSILSRQTATPSGDLDWIASCVANMRYDAITRLYQLAVTGDPKLQNRAIQAWKTLVEGGQKEIERSPENRHRLLGFLDSGIPGNEQRLALQFPAEYVRIVRTPASEAAGAATLRGFIATLPVPEPDPPLTPGQIREDKDDIPTICGNAPISRTDFFGMLAKRWPQAYMRALMSAREDVKAVMVRYLPIDPSVTPLIRSLALDKDSWVRWHAMMRFENDVDSSAVTLARIAIKDEWACVRLSGIEVLAHAEPEHAWELLSRYAFDRSYGIRERVEPMLERLNDPRTLPLVAAKLRSSDKEIADAAIEILRWMNTEAATRLLMIYAENPGSAFRVDAVSKLSTSDSRDLLRPFFARMSRDRNVEILKSWLFFVEEDHDLGALPRLRELVQSRDLNLRRMVRNTMRRLVNPDAPEGGGDDG